MILTIKQNNKVYTIAEYDSELKTLKMTEGSEATTGDEFEKRLKKPCHVYNPRDQESHLYTKSTDKFRAYLFLTQAIYQTKATNIEFEGMLYDEDVPPEIPGIKY